MTDITLPAAWDNTTKAATAFQKLEDLPSANDVQGAIDKVAGLPDNAALTVSLNGLASAAGTADGKAVAAQADATNAKTETDRLKITKPAAKAQTLADALSLSVASNVLATDLIQIVERETGTGIGANTYQLIDGVTTRPAEDGGSIIHVGAGNLYLKGLFPAGVWVEQFGAKPVVGFDNKSAFEKAAAYLKTGVLNIGYGLFELASTAYLPIGIYLTGRTGNRGFDNTYTKSTGLSPTASATLTQDFLFFMNIDPTGDTEAWVEAFPNNDSGGAFNLTVDASKLIGNCHGFKFGGSYIFKNITNKKTRTLIAKPSGLYTDKVVIDQIHSISRSNDTEYLIDLPGTGDGYYIANIETGYLDGQDGMTNGVNVGRCRAGQIFGLINGRHLLNGCKAVEVYGCHIEGGNITLKDCNANVHDNILFCEEDVNGQIILASDNNVFGNRYEVTIENNVFDQSMNRRGGFQQTARPDIIVHDAFTVKLKNNKRKITDSTALSLHQYHGILLGTGPATMLSDFNDYSHLFSNYDSLIIANQVIKTGVIPSQNKVFDGVNVSTVAIDSTTFNAATATYYYHTQLLQDPIRKLGKNAIAGEKSITLTSGGNICQLDIQWNTTVNTGCAILRIYRGLATGAYTQFVDVPLVSCKKLYDTGVNISGFVWKARASGGLDSLNSGINEAITFCDGLIDMKSMGGKPTAGSWLAGDEVRKINPTPPGPGLSVNNRFLRLTSGSAHVTSTDWLILQNTQG